MHAGCDIADREARLALLRELLGSVGEGTETRPPLYCDYGCQTHVGARSFINFGVIVGPGVSIGENTVVGAGAVVVRDLPASVLAVGNPARVLRSL